MQTNTHQNRHDFCTSKWNRHKLKVTKLQRKTEKNISKKMWNSCTHSQTEPGNGFDVYAGESAWTIAYSHSRLTAMIQIKPFCLAIKFNVLLEMRTRAAGQRVYGTSAPLQPLTHAAATKATTATTCMCILYAWMNSLFEFACNSTQFDQIHRFCLFYSVCSNKTTHIHQPDTNKYIHTLSLLGLFLSFSLAANAHLNFIHSKIYVTLRCCWY